MRIHGNRGQVKMDPTGGSTVVEVASLNEFNLDVSRDRVDVTAFGDTNKQSVSGLPNYSGDFKGFWDSLTTPALFDVIFGDVPAMLHLIPDRLAPTYLFKGPANLDGKIHVSSTGAVTIDGTFAAASGTAWVMEP